MSVDVNRYSSDALLENDPRFIVDQLDLTGVGQDECRADCRMPSEWQFVLGCEDAQFPGIGRIFGWKDKDRLGKIELAGDLLHKFIAQTASIGKDGQLVASEDHVGEDICSEITVFHISVKNPVATGSVTRFLDDHKDKELP